MKICWDNLENIHLTVHGNFRGNTTYYEHEACLECGEPYLSNQKNFKHCSCECSMKSIEVKRNMSKSAKKRMKNPLNNPIYGKGHNEETKRKMSLLKQNVYIGSANPNWRGGISFEPYCPLWTDKEYKNWIKYERDGGICQNPQCKHKTTRICLHHINYDKKDCRPVNLITLCNSCNSEANFDREWHTAFYNEMIKRK